MSFKMKYQITSKFITPKTDRRPGVPIQKVRFITDHDTGNPGATAMNHYDFYMNNLNGDKSSAQIFVDDKVILEVIPAFKNPEKAYQVMRSKTKDNELFGYDAIDVSIGVEWCYGGKIDSKESYKKYVWTLAYLCYLYGLDPYKHNIGHFLLDPKRRSDPVSGLKTIGKTYEQFKQDIVNEYKDCIKEPLIDIKDEIVRTAETIVKKIKNNEQVIKPQLDWMKNKIDEYYKLGGK